ncbi:MULTISPECIES: MucR family transcriptional regulator [unclassified Desulfovibrio]|uniref:MucR family transcriptional regulator n=1 Tax=unclassified Desulfovibrio TaxID=2593640 RepID=UPI002FD8D00B
MALEDKDLFNAIFNKYSDQPIEFIMEQYEKAKILNIAIEKRQQSQPVTTDAESATDAMTEPSNAENVTPKKKYTKRDLVVKPQAAITDEHIKCCICGQERSILTSRHLAQHGITVDEYKTLCRYDAKQPLMSNNRIEHARVVIAKAQQARKAKKASE